jgi:hypothetical protein
MSNPWRSGTFDDWYSADPQDLWIEYKYQPKLGSVKADLSPLQFHWGSERFAERRNVAVIVGMPQGGIVLHRDEWEIRIPVLQVEQRLLKRKQICELIALFVTSAPSSNIFHELWEYI